MSDQQCPYCGNTECFIRVNDEVVCCKCGYVIDEDVVSMEPAPIYDREKIRFKVNNANPQIPILNMLRPYSVEIKDGNLGGRSASSYSSKDKFYFKVKNKISEIGEKLGLNSDIKNLTLLIVMKYSEKLNSKPRNLDGVIAAATYIAHRIRGNPKPMDFISKKLGIKKKVIIKYFKDIREGLKIKLQPPKPEKYIQYFGRELKLSNECISLALRILNKIKQKRIHIGFEPKGMAAAIIYYASEITGEIRGKKEIAEVASVTELTIRKKYSIIKNILENTSYSG